MAQDAKFQPKSKAWLCRDSDLTNQKQQLQSVGDTDPRVTFGEILDVTCNQKHGAIPRRGPNHRIRQFDPMPPAQVNRARGDPLVQADDLKAAQKIPRRRLEIGRRPDHHLHPGDDADRFVGMERKLGPGFGNGVQIVDQNIRVEQRLHHSLRAFP